MKAALGPVTVRTKYRRMLVHFVLRAVQVTGHIKPGQAFKKNFLDRIVAPVHQAVDHCIQCSLGGHWPETRRDQDLAANLRGPLGPLVCRRRRRKGKVAVQGLERSKSVVVG